jgi:hypothetical protein
MPRRFAIVRIAIGSLLLVAAGLKLYGLSVSAIPRVGWFSQPWVQLAAVEWELVLGIWLLSGAYLRGAWFAAILTFASFAAVSGYLGWIGVASCGCFGVIKASPWWAFGVDVAAISLLLFAWPRSQTHSATSDARVIPRVLMGSVAASGLLILCSAVVYGSVEAGLARLRGEPLVVEPSYVEFDDAAPGATVKRQIRIRNLTSHPIHLIGGTSDCSCATTAGLPIAVAPGGFVDLPIRLAIPSGTEGQFTRTAEIWTDLDRKPVIRLVLGCRVAPKADDQ